LSPAPRLPAARTRAGLNALLLLLIAAGIALIYQQRSTGLPGLETRQAEELPPITSLHPQVAAARDKLIAASSAVGIPIAITDEFRSHKEQEALFRKGRTDGGSIVTHARGGESYHNYGLAIDYALRTESGDVIWDLAYDGNGNGRSDWLEVAAIAKKLGFEWGGDFTSFKDYPHLQMDFGLSIGELKRGKRPPAPPAPPEPPQQ